MASTIDDQGHVRRGLPGGRVGHDPGIEWSVYDKRNLFLNKQQLLVIGDRNFPVCERRLEFQHPNMAFFNVAFQNNRPKEY